jgi:hypothetical protein
MGLSKDMKLKKSWCITAAIWLRVKKIAAIIALFARKKK